MTLTLNMKIESFLSGNTPTNRIKKMEDQLFRITSGMFGCCFLFVCFVLFLFLFLLGWNRFVKR